MSAILFVRITSQLDPQEFDRRLLSGGRASVTYPASSRRSMGANGDGCRLRDLLLRERGGATGVPRHGARPDDPVRLRGGGRTPRGVRGALPALARAWAVRRGGRCRQVVTFVPATRAVGVGRAPWLPPQPRRRLPQPRRLRRPARSPSSPSTSDSSSSWSASRLTSSHGRCHRPRGPRGAAPPPHRGSLHARVVPPARGVPTCEITSGGLGCLENTPPWCRHTVHCGIKSRGRGNHASARYSDRARRDRRWRLRAVGVSRSSGGRNSGFFTAVCGSTPPRSWSPGVACSLPPT